MEIPETDKMFTALMFQQDLRDNAGNTSLSSGMALMQKKKYKEAITAFKQATAYKPDIREAYDFMADAYQRLGKTKEAVDALKISAQLDKTREDPHINLANIYMAEKKFVDAEKELKEAIRINPGYDLPKYTLGHLYNQTNRYSEAVSEFKKVIKISPKDANGYYSLGMALNKLGKYDEAVPQLIEATKMKKDFALAQYELGFAYAKLDKKDKAQEQINSLKKIMTGQAQDLARKLETEIKQPKIFSNNYSGTAGSLALTWSAGTELSLLNFEFGDKDVVAEADWPNYENLSKDFTVQFQFDSEMDAASVVKLANWSITKASGGSGGLYTYGTPSDPNEALVSPLPKSVAYDPETLQATLSFTVTQPEIGAKIDPSHLVFKFSGTDIYGKSMDPSGDEYDGAADVAF